MTPPTIQSEEFTINGITFHLATMWRWLLLGAIYGTAFSAWGQSTALPGETAGSYWSMDEKQASAALTTPTVPTARWFAVHLKGFDIGNSVGLEIDDKKMDFAVHVDGWALVYGKRLLFTRYSGTAGFLGEWRTIDPAYLQKNEFAWAVHPEANKEVLIAHLDVNREFVIAVGATNSPDDCSDVRVKPIVDNKPVPDKTVKDSLLSQNGSLIGFGTDIRLSFQGKCKPGKAVGGIFRLL